MRSVVAMPLKFSRVLLCLALMPFMLAPRTATADGEPSVSDLLRRIEALEKRVRELESLLTGSAPTGPSGGAPTPPRRAPAPTAAPAATPVEVVTLDDLVSAMPAELLPSLAGISELDKEKARKRARLFWDEYLKAKGGMLRVSIKDCAAQPGTPEVGDDGTIYTMASPVGLVARGKGRVLPVLLRGNISLKLTDADGHRLERWIKSIGGQDAVYAAQPPMQFTATLSVRYIETEVALTEGARREWTIQFNGLEWKDVQVEHWSWLKPEGAPSK